MNGVRTPWGLLMSLNMLIETEGCLITRRKIAADKLISRKKLIDRISLPA